MRTIPLILSVSFGLTVGCSDQSSPIAADKAIPLGTWVSDQASISLTDQNATIQILTAGCVGSFGAIGQSIPEGNFSLSGTYTQLIGAYPGRLQYAAQYTGVLDGNQLTLTITVATLPQAIGPFELHSGTKPTWPQCAYP